MKSRILTLSLALVALTALSCSKSPSETEVPEESKQIKVQPTVVTATKGEYTTQTVESFDLLIDNPRDSRYTYTNTRFTRNKSGKWESAAPMLWEKPAGDKQDVNLLAISPAIATGGHAISDDPITEIEVEQAQSADSRGSDYLWGWIGKDDWGSTCFNGTGELQLVFVHIVSMLRIEVTFGTDMNYDDVLSGGSPIENLKVDGTVRKANIRKLSSYDAYEIVPGTTVSAEPISPYLASWQPSADKNGRGKAIYECMVIPQQRIQITVSFTMDGMEYRWTSGSIDFYYNTRYTLPLRIGKDSIVAEDITTSPWSDGGAHDIETN